MTSNGIATQNEYVSNATHQLRVVDPNTSLALQEALAQYDRLVWLELQCVKLGHLEQIETIHNQQQNLIKDLLTLTGSADFNFSDPKLRADFIHKLHQPKGGSDKHSVTAKFKCASKSEDDLDYKGLFKVTFVLFIMVISIVTLISIVFLSLRGTDSFLNAIGVANHENHYIGFLSVCTKFCISTYLLIVIPAFILISLILLFKKLLLMTKKLISHCISFPLKYISELKMSSKYNSILEIISYHRQEIIFLIVSGFVLNLVMAGVFNRNIWDSHGPKQLFFWYLITPITLFSLYKVGQKVLFETSHKSRPERPTKLEQLVSEFEIAESRFNTPYFTEIKEYIFDSVIDDIEGMHKVFNDGIDPQTAAYSMIANRAADLVETGQNHVYRGILSPKGKAFYKIFKDSIDTLLSQGALTLDEAELSKDQLFEQIQTIG